jgi:site-specific DNA-methyltransferase (adenine-specific)
MQGLRYAITIMWIYGSGFPKSLDVSKAIDKAAGAEREVVGYHQNPAKSLYTQGKNELPNKVPLLLPATAEAKQWQGFGTALKPAHEPIVLARKPLVGTVAANVLEWGTGGLNIDGSQGCKR